MLMALRPPPQLMGWPLVTCSTGATRLAVPLPACLPARLQGWPLAEGILLAQTLGIQDPQGPRASILPTIDIGFSVSNKYFPWILR